MTNLKNKEKFIEEFVDKPGILIYNESVLVTRSNKTPEIELVRFVLNTLVFSNMPLIGYIYDYQYKKANNSIMEFKTIDEFLAFKNYLCRNGISIAE